MEPADIVLYYCGHQTRVIVVEAGFANTLVYFKFEFNLNSVFSKWKWKTIRQICAEPFEDPYVFISKHHIIAWQSKTAM